MSKDLSRRSQRITVCSSPTRAAADLECQRARLRKAGLQSQLQAVPPELVKGELPAGSKLQVPPLVSAPPQALQLRGRLDPQGTLPVQRQHPGQGHHSETTQRSFPALLVQGPGPENSPPPVVLQALRSKAGASRPVHAVVLLREEGPVLVAAQIAASAPGVADAEQDVPIAQGEKVRTGAVLFLPGPTGVGTVEGAAGTPNEPGRYEVNR